MDSYQYPIFAKEQKDVPEWMKSYHEWQAAVDINKLPKVQLKVKMCCQKCEEKVIEEIREVHGVFDVRAERMESKVVVVGMPTPKGLDEHEVLKKAKKLDRRAKFVELDAKEKPKKDDKKKEDEEKKKKEAEEKKKKEQEASISNIYTWKPLVHWGGPYYAPQPAYNPGEYRPSQWYAPRYHYPPLPNQPDDGQYRQYVYHSGY